jgi:hypothetical protein
MHLHKRRFRCCDASIRNTSDSVSSMMLYDPGRWMELFSMSNHDNITLQKQHQREIELGIAWACGTIQGVVRQGICVEPNADGQRLLFDLALYPAGLDPWVFTSSNDSAHYFCPRVQIAFVPRQPPLPQLIPPRPLPGVSFHGGLLMSRGFIDRCAKDWIGTEGEARDPPLQSTDSRGKIGQTWQHYSIFPCHQKIVLASPSVGPAEQKIYLRKPWLVANSFWLCDESEPFCLLDADWVNSSGQAHMVFHPQGACFFPRNRAFKPPF